jgi:hypothetical protein
MGGSFLFNATPMAPPSTKVLVYLKPTHHKSWSFNTSNGWYIGPSLKHYNCIRTIMEGTSSKQLTDTCCFKHYAMPVPVITPMDRIISTTQQLTDAIAGVQEAPPNKLQATATLCHTLLGELPPIPIPINLAPSFVPTTPVAPIALSSLADTDNKPIHMWDPLHVPNHILTLCHTTIITDSDAHIVPAAIIKVNNSKPTPATSIHHNQCTRMQHCCTQAQHCAAHIHLINLAITKALMPMIHIKPTITYSLHGLIAATHTLHLHTWVDCGNSHSPQKHLRHIPADSLSHLL